MRVGTCSADQAEQRVLWDLEAALESRLEAVVAADYSDHLHAARALVRATRKTDANGLDLMPPIVPIERLYPGGKTLGRRLAAGAA